MAVTTTSTSITSPAKFSWADIVKGSEEPTKYTLKPAMRGERRCFCQGEMLVMLGHYGWILPLDEIDHPDIGKTGGRVYVHKRDVAKGVSLVKGDIVSFYLYVDDQGLGAEECDLQQHASVGEGQEDSVEIRQEPTLRADADDFVPSLTCPAPGWNLGAAEFVPMAPTIPSSFNAQATEFVPGSLGVIHLQGATVASDFTPKPSELAINPAFLSDDESDDESSTVSNGGFSGVDADKESIDSDTESICNESVRSFQSDREVQWSSQLDAVVLRAPLKSPRASSVDDSTSVGASDSESEDAATSAERPPPGLSLPAGFRPPPGLSLPVFAA